MGTRGWQGRPGGTVGSLFTAKIGSRGGRRNLTRPAEQPVYRGRGRLATDFLADVHARSLVPAASASAFVAGLVRIRLAPQLIYCSQLALLQGAKAKANRHTLVVGIGVYPSLPRAAEPIAGCNYGQASSDDESAARHTGDTVIIRPRSKPNDLRGRSFRIHRPGRPRSGSRCRCRARFWTFPSIRPGIWPSSTRSRSTGRW